LSDATCGAITADHSMRSNFVCAVAGTVAFDDEAGAIGVQILKATTEFQFNAAALCFFGESFDQGRAFDDQVGLMQRYGGGAAVGEKFKSIDFVDDGFFGEQIAKNISEFVGDDEGASDGLEAVGLFEDLCFEPFASQQRSRK
jgi:hypothetical protein